MIKTRIIKDITGKIDLCETFSDEHEKLLQVETGLIYDETAIDTIAGFNEDGTPYSRFHYEEVIEENSLDEIGGQND